MGGGVCPGSTDKGGDLLGVTQNQKVRRREGNLSRGEKA